MQDLLCELFCFKTVQACGRVREAKSARAGMTTRSISASVPAKHRNRGPQAAVGARRVVGRGNAKLDQMSRVKS